jgi:tetratricopeptide (TPR) repeat protein
MSVASPPEPAQKPKEPQQAGLATATETRSERSTWMTRAADLSLIAMFLILTFLLGAFPLKDADIYWHLRTGDLIRQTGKVPRVDIFTFTREGVPWIDLHWIFQIAISWLHEHGGVVALNVAKCGVTCLAVLILLSARRREWPLPVMVLAWLPALLLLGGRIYVRPETLTLLYLSVFLAVILRWDRFPRLAMILPLIQVAWVNSQGLFVLGPILLGFGLLDAALRFGIFAPERRRWWRTILISSLATGLACLINPYGIKGALYPLELAGTMSNPIFSKHVAELIPIPTFIKQAGWWNLPLQLHLLTMLLGGLSFLIPLWWRIAVSLRRLPAPASIAASQGPAGGEKRTAGRGKKRSRSAGVKGPKPGPPPVREAPPSASWQLSPFRLLLYAAFSILSLQATRNSHQFAAVVGTVTAWNFGEWAAAIRARRQARGEAVPTRWAIPARPLAFAAVAVTLLWVGSGQFFRMTGEGRTIALGEDALWFPHKAAQFAGKAGMPSRFLSFHDGHAALFEYYHGPERKVYIDPRLEVAGADLYRRYTDLGERIKKDKPGWEEQLAEMERPVILNDHLYNSEVGGTLLRSAHWRCVWFDAIAAVFVHDSFRSVVQADAVDFAARHFRPSPSKDTRDRAELAASGKAIAKYVIVLVEKGDAERARPLALLGLADSRRLLQQEPDSLDSWKNLGVIELFRGLPHQPVARFRAPFDPVYDLSIVRATLALRRALELAPRDPLTANALRVAYDTRLMHEAVLPLLDRIKEDADGSLRADYQRKMGSPPPTTWRNLSELDQIVTAFLASGRALSAVLLLEKAYPPEHAPWEVADRIASLWLHLGEPARARAVWENAVGVPDRAIRESRIGTTFLAEGDFESARKHFRLALEAKPDRFEALYCLAVLEQDDGNAAAAYDLAKRAMTSAPDEASRSAARSISSSVARFARPVMELAGEKHREAAPGSPAGSP